MTKLVGCLFGPLCIGHDDDKLWPCALSFVHVLRSSKKANKYSRAEYVSYMFWQRNILNSCLLAYIMMKMLNYCCCYRQRHQDNAARVRNNSCLVRNNYFITKKMESLHDHAQSVQFN